MKPIYLDNNATTMVAPEVLEAMLPFLSERYGNPSSMHGFGGSVGRAIATAREQVAAGLNCRADEIVFTSCGTEADNTALHCATAARPERRHIATTRVEHSAVLNYAKHLESHGHGATLLAVDTRGRLDLDEARSSLQDETAVLSVMWANNETGTIYPVRALAELARERGVLFHTDAVQAVGKVVVDMAAVPVDYLALSGHKLHAPKGVGALFVRRGAPFRPFLIGGHQEHGRRGGTENVASIVALGAAVELAMKHLDQERTTVRALRDRLQAGLLAAIPDAMVNGDGGGGPDDRLPNTLSIAFKYVEGEALLLLLDQHGICASSGSACTSGSLEPSHVLRAMGVPFTFAHGSLRFSLSRYTTAAEVDAVLAHLPQIVVRLRQMSPYGHEGSACGVTRTTE